MCAHAHTVAVLVLFNAVAWGDKLWLIFPLYPWRDKLWVLLPTWLYCDSIGDGIYYICSIIYGANRITDTAGPRKIEQRVHPIMWWPFPVATCHIWKLSVHKRSSSAGRPWNIEEWIEMAEVFKNSKYFSTLTLCTAATALASYRYEHYWAGCTMEKVTYFFKILWHYFKAHLVWW